jgi:hypothetical protein
VVVVVVVVVVMGAVDVETLVVAGAVVAVVAVELVPVVRSDSGRGPARTAAANTPANARHAKTAAAATRLTRSV